MNISLLPWQLDVLNHETRFKVVAAGRRTGKSHLAAVSLVINALNDKPGKVFYVAPTQGMARDIMWDKLYELFGDIIVSHNVNNLTLTLQNGATLYLKGADRPDTLRGVSLKHLVLDEYAFMKGDVFDAILRPALSDQMGTAMFIGTPEGRNHFFDVYSAALTLHDNQWNGWHFTSYDNPTIARSEIEHARKTLPNWAFQQEYMASFDARGGEHFDVDKLDYYEKLPENTPGDYFIAIDLAGFEQTAKGQKTKRRDNSAIACVYVTDDGHWYVEEIIYGRWSLDETAEKIFRAVQKYKPVKVGIEKGIAQQAVMSPLMDLMRRTSRVFRIETLSHGNQKKTARILWALEGRVENDLIHLKREDWNIPLVDEASNFPSPLVHDDMLDALSYVDQLVTLPYLTGDDEIDEWEPLDAVAGY